MKNIITILLAIHSLSFFGQIQYDCFNELKLEADEFFAGMEKATVGLTAENLLNASESRQERLIGCDYPSSQILTFDTLEINPTKFSTDYVIINFNRNNCDICTSELDWFVKLKKQTKKTVTIVIFFKEKTDEVSAIINKYKNELYFVTDAKEYIKSHSLGAGKPLNYILDKNKKILYAKSGTGQTYEGLIEVLK
ncbi:MAG: redoxin domain-containing protein [Bacteroidota bacterium]